MEQLRLLQRQQLQQLDMLYWPSGKPAFRPAAFGLHFKTPTALTPSAGVQLNTTTIETNTLANVNSNTEELSMPSYFTMNTDSSAFASNGATASPSASEGMNPAAAMVLDEVKMEEQTEDK